MDRFFHSVFLDKDKCCGCTVCVRKCPTEAIRVRDGKAFIIKERCIDCGNCVRVCPQRAKQAKFDKLSDIENFKYKIAMPAPSLYGQFPNVNEINLILTAIKRLGFDEVYEVSKAAELVSSATRKILEEERDKLKFPVISSACPAITRLIRVRYPNLCSHVLPLNAPMETAAVLAKEEAHQRLGIPKKDICCVFITPCAAKVTDSKVPIGLPKSAVDLAISINEVFPLIADQMKHLEYVEHLSRAGVVGMSWAVTGGEAQGCISTKYLAADGVNNCIRVLEELEDDKLQRIEFIELNACMGGCVGGIACVENPYVAKARLQHLKKYLPRANNNRIDRFIPYVMRWNEELNKETVMSLSDDIMEAMAMMMEIDELSEGLPQKDCGACGAPTCRALAEDVVKGQANIDDCIFIKQESLQKRIEELEKQIASQDGGEHDGK